jgi:hypothetical protein
VGLGAIIVVGANREIFSHEASCESPAFSTEAGLSAEPLAGSEILGRSTLERIIERFVRVEVDVISVLVQAEFFPLAPFRGSFGNVSVHVVSDIDSAIARKLREYSMTGVQRSFVQCAEAYTETDLLDLFYFHREARQIATRAFDREGALALWVVDCGISGEPGVVTVLREAGRNDASYFVRGYVHRLTHPRDLREIAVDMLHGRCEKGITGKEIRPGVWIDEGARVHGRARIVAPAYIGCGSKVRADTLITRSSSVERDCCVDYGTVIEDSSVLPRTHVGIWLDVCHAVANGNRLYSLKRDVAVEILDPSVMRSTVAVLTADAGASDWNEARMMAADFEREYLTQGTWQWDPNLIQE